jgi:hypothetical protein
VRPGDFFGEEYFEQLGGTRRVFDSPRVDQLRLQPEQGISDLDAAHALTQLAHDELVTFGTGRGEQIGDEDSSVVLRSLRAILKRLGIAFDPPFRDFQGFRTYWIRHDMRDSWAARRNYLDDLFTPVFSRLEELEDEQASSAVRGVDGKLRNLIFASTGPKPRIVLRDAVNNVIEVVENEQNCIFYDRPLTEAGLTWGELVDWWGGFQGQTRVEAGRTLYRRLAASLGSPPEHTLFRTYCERYRPGEDGDKQPALLPQVYLHFDPRTRRERGGQPSVLMRERMDFLLLLPRGVRIVLEVDGKQHYAEGDTASPKLYSEMVSEDRRLRLRGYDVYRFGAYELSAPGAADRLREFFGELLARHEAG